MQMPAQHFNLNISGLFRLIKQADAPRSGQYNTLLLLQPNSRSCARETSAALTPAWCSNTDGPPHQPRVPTLSGYERPPCKVTSTQL